VNAVLQHLRPAPTRTLADLRNAYLRSAADDDAAALDDLLAERPGLAAAHVLKIGKLVATKDMRTFPALERALEAAQPHLRAGNEQDRMHAAAATAWLAHRPLLAAHSYSTISANDPHDLLALRLAQSCWFFLARRAKVHAVAERAARAWSPHDESHDVALALLAFGCAEIGDGARAETLSMRALEIEPRNPYALHALAHALGALRQPATAVRLLAARAEDWRVGGRLESHTSWHLAVAELEVGNVAAADAALDELVPLATQGPSAASDATDLAWRLELAGADVAETWNCLADAWSRHHVMGFWAPDDILAGIAYVRAERWDGLRALQRKLAAGPHLRRCAERAAYALTLPALAAIEAFARADFRAAEAQLRATIDRMGGSLLQRELFELTLEASGRRRAPFAPPPAALRIPA
jgi:tetratricopeptide repeat protein